MCKKAKRRFCLFLCFVFEGVSVSIHEARHLEWISAEGVEDGKADGIAFITSDGGGEDMLDVSNAQLGNQHSRPSYATISSLIH